jgi:hypothetical protein
MFTAISILGYLMHSFGIEVGGDPSKLPVSKDLLTSFVGKLNWTPEKPSQAYVAPRLYGDDISCDSSVTGHITDLLERCGLVVNRGKSFTGGQMIRESCGIYAYDGHDVTPVLFRVKTHKEVLDAQVFASLISQINIAGDNRYHNMRKNMLSYLLNDACIDGLHSREEHRRLMPFTEDRNQFGIYTKCLHIKNMKVRESPVNEKGESLQRTEIRRLVLRGVKGRGPAKGFDLYRFDQDMRARIYGSSSEIRFSVPYIRPSLTRVTVAWTPQ